MTIATSQQIAPEAATSPSIQFESDEIMRRSLGAIACCVSPRLMGKQMQFFGARANLAKCLLYAIDGGRVTGEQVGPTVDCVKRSWMRWIIRRGIRT